MGITAALVALAIVSLVITLAYRTISDTMKAQSNVMKTAEVDNYRSLLTMALMTKCSKVLLGATPPNKILPTLNATTPVILNPAEIPLPPTGVTTTSTELKTSVIGGTAGSYVGEIVLNFKKSGSFLGSQSLVRTLPVLVTANALNEITSCSSGTDLLLRQQVCTDMGLSWNPTTVPPCQLTMTPELKKNMCGVFEGVVDVLGKTCTVMVPVQAGSSIKLPCILPLASNNLKQTVQMLADLNRALGDSVKTLLQEKFAEISLAVDSSEQIKKIYALVGVDAKDTKQVVKFFETDDFSNSENLKLVTEMYSLNPVQGQILLAKVQSTMRGSLQ